VVEFVVNAPYPDVLKWLSRASIGLSTMVDEHFGINIVEFMVSLPSPIGKFVNFCHIFVLGCRGNPSDARLWRSAKRHRRPFQRTTHRYCVLLLCPPSKKNLCINGRRPGYHATTPEAFAEMLHLALTLDPVEDLALRRRTRTWAVQQFSEEQFIKGWDASGWRNWVFESSL
jgi:alpha-1,2-mannosyltransferase